MQTSLKIAVVTSVLPDRGGMGNVAIEHARLLAEHGHEVTVLSPDYKRAAFDSSDRFKTELIKPLLQYGNAAWVPSLTKRLKDFDVVELHYPFFGGAGAVKRAQKKYGFKLMVYYHMDVVGQGIRKVIFSYNTRFFLPRLIKAADIVATSSLDLGKYSYLGKFWNDNNFKFQVIPIGVNSQNFVFSSEPRERVVLFVGVLDTAHYFKGIEVLLRATSLISLSDFKVMLVGDGNLRAHYEKLAEDLSIADKVIFTGAAQGQILINFMQKAMVTVLASTDSESFGIVLVESLACGTPVIASDLPGVRSVFENNISGFTVSPGDKIVLAEKIKYILNNPDKARAMGEAGRKLVEEKYDWQKIGNKLNSLLVK